MTTATETAIIENRLVTVSVGDYVKLDSGRAEWLKPCEWDGASFRYPGLRDVAVNVSITGRTFQYRQGFYYVRVRIEFVGDGEPSSFCGGWLEVNPFVLPEA